MSKHANPAAIGAFVLGSIGLIILAIVVFSSIKFISQKDRYVVYFAGSVNGLKVGAPVKLKGVQVGQVTGIQAEFNFDEAVVRTPVFLEIDMARVNFDSGDIPDNESDLIFESLIRHGLRAQLESQSLLTGQLYVEINFYPRTPINLVGSNTKLKEIPAIPSDTEEMLKKIGAIINKLDSLPFGELFGSLLTTAETLEKFVSSPEWMGSAQQLSETLDAIRTLTEKIKTDIDPMMAGVTATLQDTRKLILNVNEQVEPMAKATQQTLIQAQRSLESLEYIANQDSPIHTDITNTLNELSEAARSIRILANYLQRNPEAIVYGKQGSGDE